MSVTPISPSQPVEATVAEGAMARFDTTPVELSPSACAPSESRQMDSTASTTAEPHRAGRFSFRHSVECVVVLLVVVLMIRTFVAEAYIVPTGSMAPTLIGHHKVGRCPRCGYRTRVGRQGQGIHGVRAANREAERHYRLATCANCGWDQLHLERVDECPGDRLLVQKHLYDFRQPKRWELVVFRSPEHTPEFTSNTLVKRVVGLPGETIQVRDGEVWINGGVARKSWRQAREMAVLVFDNDHQPNDAPQPFRWRGVEASSWRSTDGGTAFRLPSDSEAKGTHWLVYHHLVRRRLLRGDDHWTEDAIRNVAGYNGGQEDSQPIHDLMLGCEVSVAGRGWLSFAITDGLDDVRLDIPVGLNEPGRLIHVPLNRSDRIRTGKSRAKRRVHPLALRLASRQTVTVHFGLVDRRVNFAVDGQLAVPPVDLSDPPPSAGRRSLRRPLATGGHGPVAVGGRGIDLTVRHLQLSRDIHYSSGQAGQPYRHAVTKPVYLARDEYFVLGDNTANSYDSRCWITGPAVHRQWLVGKAILVHLPSQNLVLKPFGRRWVVRIPDWHRIRWLR